MGQNVSIKVGFMAQESIYEAADFFLTRFALLPQKEIELSQEALFDFYKNTPLFQEAVAVASNSLHESLQKGLEGKEEFSKLFPSLLKYFLRMCSRATPFGLFSAIGWGEFTEQSDLFFPYSSLNKKAKPDAEWMKNLIDNLHSQISYVRQLRVMTNPNLVKKAGRVSLRIKREEAENFDTVSIKSTIVSDFVFYSSKAPILYSDLEDKLFEKFDEHPKERVSDYLWQIFQKGYLLSEYSLSLNQLFSFQELYNKLKEVNFSAESLEKLRTSFENYENASFGSGLQYLKEVIQNLNDSKVIKHPIQVDTYRKEGVFHLPWHVKERVEEAASILWFFSSDESSSMHEYQSQFLEKYGSSRLVPLLELIDPHFGLGFPQMAPSSKEESQLLPWKEAVFSSLKSKVVQIDSLPKELSSLPKIQKAPLSLELYFELLSSSNKAIDAGDYTIVINPMGGSIQAGSTFGRFLHLCKPSEREQLCSFLQKEEALNSEEIFVEASFLPDNPRVANVAFHGKLRNFQLQMHFHETSSQSIELEDIYVGSTLDRLYLYSKKWGEKLYVTKGCAIGLHQVPAVLKLLLQISKNRFTSFSSSMWKSSENDPFLPRFCYKNVILSPARWLFRSPTLGLSEKPSPTEIEKALTSALISFEVPDLVYLTHFDNRILVNWKNEDHRQLIVQHFINKKEILLFEANYPSQGVQSEKGRHVAEFVVPCIRKEVNKTDGLSKNYPPCDQISPLDRLQLPGGEWLYIKLFLSRENEELFLSKQIHPLVQDLLDKRLIDKWFYVRYQEEKAHVRLRLHGYPEDLCKEVIPAFYKQASSWIAEGSLSDFTFHAYEKEVERYGGPLSIDQAEELFFADSDSCLHILNQISSLDLPLSVVGALSIINLVQGFYPSLEEQIDFLSPNLQNKHLLAGFRKHTSKAVELVFSLFYKNEPHVLKEAFNKTGVAARQLSEVINEKWNTKSLVVQSVIHMHCNRLFGIDQEAEQKALVLAHHFLEKTQYKTTHKEVLCSH